MARIKIGVYETNSFIGERRGIIMAIKELNKKDIKSINPSTFRLESVISKKDGDKLEFYFGDFIDEDSVKILSRVRLPFRMASLLANNITVACAEYQHETGTDLGLPNEFCKKIVKEKKKILKERKEGDIL